MGAGKLFTQPNLLQAAYAFNPCEKSQLFQHSAFIKGNNTAGVLPFDHGQGKNVTSAKTSVRVAASFVTIWNSNQDSPIPGG